MCVVLVQKLSVVCDFGGGGGGTNWAVVTVSVAIAVTTFDSLTLLQLGLHCNPNPVSSIFTDHKAYPIADNIIYVRD